MRCSKTSTRGYRKPATHKQRRPLAVLQKCGPQANPIYYILRCCRSVAYTRKRIHSLGTDGLLHRLHRDRHGDGFDRDGKGDGIRGLLLRIWHHAGANECSWGTVCWGCLPPPSRFFRLAFFPFTLLWYYFILMWLINIRRFSLLCLS